MATPTAIQTGLEVATDRAAPTPAPMATPTPALAFVGLFATGTSVSPRSMDSVRYLAERLGRHRALGFGVDVSSDGVTVH
jgi:hypothetical protein